MFIEQFTENARGVIILARQEALRTEYSCLDTEHLLLGLISKEDCVATKIIQNLGLDTNDIRFEIEKRLLATHTRIDKERDIPFTERSKKVLELSIKEAKFMMHEKVGTAHILLGLIKLDCGVAYSVLNSFGFDLDKTRREFMRILSGKDKEKKIKASTEILDRFSYDLTKAAREKKLDPVIGRDREIERLIQILCRRTKNNPVLIGEPGVGKTAIVEGLAQRVVEGKVPEDLENKRVIALDLGLLVSGTKYRGQFEERLTVILKEISQANLIIFIDELHTIIGTGSAEGSLDASNLLKPSLARGMLQCIGATTIKEYRRIENDGALERRFQRILVEPTNVENTLKIVNGLKDKYEAFHNIQFDNDSIIQAVLLSDNYISDRYLPDKAIDVLDEAACRAKMRRDKNSHEEIIVTPEDVVNVITTWTGIPVNKMNDSELEKIKNIDIELSKVVIGQDNAIKAVSETIKRSKTGIRNPVKPIGSFMFVGPSGVGKTELSKCLAEYLFGRRDSIIQLDMSEYSQPFSISKLVGSPPGYVGYEEGGQLLEKVRRKPHSIILLDEIEKASIDVINAFLQMLEEGHMTDGKGRKVSFKNTIIIMTSNIGKNVEMDKSLGFKTISSIDNYRKKKTLISNELKRRIPVEFLNRIDNIVIFENLTKKNIYDIIDLEINKLGKKLMDRNINISIEPDAKEWFMNNGFSTEYGARFLNRCIETNICNKISDGILNDKFHDGDELSITISDNKIEIMALDNILT